MNRTLKWVSGALIIGGIAALADAIFLEQYFFELKTFRIGNLAGKTRIRILLLTDLHFRRFLLPHYRKLAALINQEAPDLILIAGDTIDMFGTLDPAERFFALLPPEIPKVAIPGNHDHKSEVGLMKLKSMLARHNGDLLLNETKTYHLKNTSITITGLDDFIEGKANLRKAVKDTCFAEHHFLLIHSPLQQEHVLKTLAKINEKRPVPEHLHIRYIFAGHNHGGQVRLPWFVPVLPDKSGDYVQGWYNNKPPYLYLSRGFGTSVLPFRFFARSEVTVFDYGV